LTVVFLFVFSSCDGGKDSVILNHSTTTRAVGCSFTLEAPALPKSVAKKLIWTSSDPTIATVEAGGIVTALAPGKAIITATMKGSNEKGSSILTVALGCNNNTPGWGEDLGTITFKTDQTWTIGDQEWSDVVMATGCRKTTFSGGPWGNQNADCRSNSNYGDLFSWCAVIRFQDQLCPDGWRVPSEEDFVQLDMALRGEGTGQRSYTDTLVREKYIHLWHGSYGGYSGVDGQLGGQNWSAYYWTQTERCENHGFRMNFHSDGYTFPKGWIGKDNGLVLRCIR